MSGARVSWAASIVLALVMAPASGCRWGTYPERLRPAVGPEGARVAVRLHGEPSDRVGELFAVDSVGVMLHATRLVHVPWPKLAAMDLLGLGSGYDVRFGETLTPEKRQRLALVSRFPHGLRGELLARVLTRLGQPTLDEVP